MRPEEYPKIRHFIVLETLALWLVSFTFLEVPNLISHEGYRDSERIRSPPPLQVITSQMIWVLALAQKFSMRMAKASDWLELWSSL